MSYFGEEKYDRNGHLISVGSYRVSDLTESQREFIGGMFEVFDMIEDEKTEYAENDTILDKLITEVSCQALDEFSERIRTEIVEHVVSFGGMNAE